MSSILRVCSETEELGGGKFRHVQSLKPVAYLRDGAMRRMGFVLADSKDLDMPLGADEGLLVKFDPRIAGKSPLWEVRAPDRTKLARFALLGANSVAAKMVSAHEYVYPNALDGADLALIYGGHFVAADFRLRAGHPKVVSWRLDSQAGFDPKALTLGELSIRQPVLLPPADKLDAASIPLKWVVSEEAGRYRLDCALPAGDYAGWTLDPTLTLQPDAAAGIDARIAGNEATNNFGINTYLVVGAQAGYLGQRTLIKFDLSGLPAAAVIVSATLSLYCNLDLSSNARAFRVYRQKRAWVEGTRNGTNDSPATGATWNRYDTTGNWSTAGGFHADDCEQTDIGSRAFTATETLNEFKDFPLTPNTKAALDLGNGWLLKSDTEAADLYGFASSDVATASQRPKLVIEYTLPGGLLLQLQNHGVLQGGVL